jgi:hypothetical protein
MISQLVGIALLLVAQGIARSVPATDNFGVASVKIAADSSNVGPHYAKTGFRMGVTPCGRCWQGSSAILASWNVLDQ